MFSTRKENQNGWLKKKLLYTDGEEERKKIGKISP